MPKTVEFYFSPGQLVTIVCYGLNLKGMIISCQLNRSGSKTYTVEYAKDDEICERDFYADQLEEYSPKPNQEI